jgi:predicted RNA-binding protein YlxR (DUF448 family)
MKAAKGPRPKHIPQRTCIGCRQEAGKRALIRIVRSGDGQVLVDSSGKANGRGAYLHADSACWEKALKGSTINNALKLTPAPTDIEALRAFAMSLPVEESGNP